MHMSERISNSGKPGLVRGCAPISQLYPNVFTIDFIKNTPWTPCSARSAFTGCWGGEIYGRLQKVKADAGLDA
jgi:hypothetical protein